MLEAYANLGFCLFVCYIMHAGYRPDKSRKNNCQEKKTTMLLSQYRSEKLQTYTNKSITPKLIRKHDFSIVSCTLELSRLFYCSHTDQVCKLYWISAPIWYHLCATRPYVQQLVHLASATWSHPESEHCVPPAEVVSISSNWLSNMFEDIYSTICW